MRYAVLALAIAAAVFCHASRALAFGSGDVAVAVDLLERLSPARGESVYYDEEAAADWYEFDQEESALIPTAGFSPESWRDTYDKTLKGLIALIPQAEYEAIHAGIDEKVASIPGLTDEQKREMVADWREHVARFDALRGEGAAYAETVRPFATRLRLLTDF